MQFGFGRHYWDINYGQLQQVVEIYPGVAVMYFWPPALTKLSLLCIFHGIDKKMGFPYYWVLVAAVTIIPTIAYTALIVGPCKSLVENTVCLNRVVISQATTNILSDLLLIAMPIPMLIRLHIPRRRKITLGLLLSFGSSSVYQSIAALVFRVCY